MCECFLSAACHNRCGQCPHEAVLLVSTSAVAAIASASASAAAQGGREEMSFVKTCDEWDREREI